MLQEVTRLADVDGAAMVALLVTPFTGGLLKKKTTVRLENK